MNHQLPGAHEQPRRQPLPLKRRLDFAPNEHEHAQRHRHRHPGTNTHTRTRTCYQDPGHPPR